jgi:hypothetical protein
MRSIPTTPSFPNQEIWTLRFPECEFEIIQENNIFENYFNLVSIGSFRDRTLPKHHLIIDRIYRINSDFIFRFSG